MVVSDITDKYIKWWEGMLKYCSCEHQRLHESYLYDSSRQQLRICPEVLFIRFFAELLASRETKCGKQWHMKCSKLDRKRICPNLADVQRVVHLRSLLPWALQGLLKELISRCVHRPYVRNLHSGGRHWLSSALIEEVQMLIQSHYIRYLSFHAPAALSLFISPVHQLG